VTLSPTAPGSTPAASGGLTQICDLTLGAAQASFDTATILGGALPTTFANLLAFVQGRGDALATSETLFMQFNGDTGANYDTELFQGVNATASASAASAQVRIFMGDFTAASATAGRSAQTRFEVANYNGTTFQKTVTGQTGSTTGALESTPFSGFWRSAAAITRLTLFLASGNFAAGTRFTLYGLK
jgi:hypothetical protein